MSDAALAWLRVQLDDDERAARAWLPLGNPTAADRDHPARHDPIRWLAEVEAKREILDLYEYVLQRQADNSARFVRLSKLDFALRDQQEFTNVKTHGWELAGRLDALRAAIGILAKPYANHPDFPQEWR